MTETEWLTCTDPTPMLDFLRGKASDRKLRLFACAASRRFWHWLDSEHDQRAIDIGEQMADGTVPRQEYAAAHIHGYDHDLGSEDAFYPALGAVCIAEVCAADDLEGGRPREVYREAEARERGILCALLRDIFGNPFRPAALDPAWRTPTVTALAMAAYEERHLPAGTLDSNRLTVLADALEDAGCDNADILSHCRGPGPHVRGCWVLDLLLGKE